MQMSAYIMGKIGGPVKVSRGGPAGGLGTQARAHHRLGLPIGKGAGVQSKCLKNERLGTKLGVYTSYSQPAACPLAT